MSEAKKQIAEMNLGEKLDVLRSIHAKSHPDAKLQIAKWAEEVERLEIDKSWLAHPNTVDLRKTITEQVSRIMVVLANDAELGETDRKALFKTKDALFILLALLSRDPVSELKEIEKQVSDNLI